MSKKVESEKVWKLGLVRESGWIYFLDKKCNVCRTKIGTPYSRELVAETDIEKEPNHLYYVDIDGDISRVDMLKYEKQRKKK